MWIVGIVTTIIELIKDDTIENWWYFEYNFTFTKEEE